jgi:hypothetical protein
MELNLNNKITTRKDARYRYVKKGLIFSRRSRTGFSSMPVWVK